MGGGVGGCEKVSEAVMEEREGGGGRGDGHCGSHC